MDLGSSDLAKGKVPALAGGHEGTATLDSDCPTSAKSQADARREDSASRPGRLTRYFLAFSFLASSCIFLVARAGFWMYRMIALA